VTVENPLVHHTCRCPNVSRRTSVSGYSAHNTEEAVKREADRPLRIIAFSQPRPSRSVSQHAGQLDPPPSRVAPENPKLWWPTGTAIPASIPSSGLRSRGQGNPTPNGFLAGVRQFHIARMAASCDWDKRPALRPARRQLGFSRTSFRYRSRVDVAPLSSDLNSPWFELGRPGGEDAFYEACDRHGIVLWQDFWLANPLDGPNRRRSDVLRNARDYILNKKHPAIGLYCAATRAIPPNEDGLGSPHRRASPRPALHPKLGVQSGEAAADHIGRRR